jgi:threonine-phosphate decarboxylase
LPWSVNSLAQAAVRFLAGHRIRIDAFIQKTRAYCENQRQQFHEMFEGTPQLKLYAGRTPFILIKLPQGISAHAVQQHLASKLILIRNCNNFKGLSDRYIRISLKAPSANRLVGTNLRALAKGALSRSEEGRVAWG